MTTPHITDTTDPHVWPGAQPQPPADAISEHFDVVIVGAGISGIGCATLLRRQLPDLRFVILDALPAHGGTWRIHRYPGTRSDSDLYTFGYSFKPWQGRPIAGRDEILDYLAAAIDDAQLGQHIRYRHRVCAADWCSSTNRWSLTVARGGDGDDGRGSPTKDGADTVCIEAGFLWMCQGYYRHDQGHSPNWPGRAQFTGDLIHPQHWPDNLDLTGRRVVVIGSGATAATLVPALAGQCAHVTMLQRTPTFFATGRNGDALADELRRLGVDPAWIHDIMRRKMVQDRADLTRMARQRPDALRQQLLAGVRASLPAGFDVERHFTPPYKPLQQRVAFVPDGDLFKAIAAGQASVVTDAIEALDARGIQLKSGARLDCDTIVTATGFDMAVMGDIPFGVDGHAVDFSRTLAFRGMLFTGVPNMAWVYGYGRYSWTLRAELVGEFVCRLLQHMRRHGHRRVTATLRPEDADMDLLPWVDPEDMNPGYLLRALDRLPRRGSRPEWQHSQDYLAEREALPATDLSDPLFVYGR